jgi:hypothetical protein
LLREIKEEMRRRDQRGDEKERRKEREGGERKGDRRGRLTSRNQLQSLFLNLKWRPDVCPKHCELWHDGVRT